MYEPYYLSCNNNFLYSEISFSSMRKYIFCINIVSQPYFLLLLSLLPFLLPRSSHSQLTFICHMPILKLSQLGSKCRHLANTISQIVNFTLFTWYFYNAVTRFISASEVLSELQQRYSVSCPPKTARHLS